MLEDRLTLLIDQDIDQILEREPGVDERHLRAARHRHANPRRLQLRPKHRLDLKRPGRKELGVQLQRSRIDTRRQSPGRDACERWIVRLNVQGAPRRDRR